MDGSEDAAVLRIGVLSRRLGVSDHVLRAWERRYGLLRPVRTPGGFRLYSEADARRVRSMQEHLARGLSAAEAAQAVLAEDGMTMENIVRLSVYVTAREHMEGYRRARDRQFPGTPPSTTLIMVAGLARPEFVVEIEAIAAAPERV